MKRYLLISLIFLLLLAACERPAREVPETVTEEDIPTNTLDEAKPDENTTEGETTTDPAANPEGSTEGDSATETTTEGDGAAEGEGQTQEGGEGEVTDTTTQPATEAEQPQSVTYEIKAGDTLFAISLLYGVSVEDIVAANNLVNPDNLEVGQLIIIPVGGLPEDSGQTDDGGETTTTPEQIHIVSAGQTLFTIGLAYGFTVEELAEYNNLADPNSLDVGQEIRIPPR